MPPTHLAPAAKPVGTRYLTFEEREDIAIALAKGAGVRAIARNLGRSASTISRELRRNAATRGGSLDYRASTAQWHADRAASRPRYGKLVVNLALRDYVQDRLAGKIANPDGVGFDGPDVAWNGRRAVHRQTRRWSTAWSPEQIAHRLQLDFPEDPTMRISHEAIYQALYIQGRGALRRDLTACLRSGRKLRMPRERVRTRGKSFIGDEIMISQRPPEVGDRAVPGHWEGDLILGLGSSAIGTLVERTTRFARGACLRITSAISLGSDAHLPRHIRVPSWRIEIAVSFNETSNPIYCSMVALRLMLGPVLIVSPFSILSGSNQLAIKVRRQGESLRDYAMFNNHRLFGPIGHIPPAEAEANYYAAKQDLNMVA